MSLAVDRGRREAGLTLPSPLSSRVVTVHHQCISSSTSARAWASPARSASVRSCPRSLPARSPPPTSRSTSTARASFSCRALPFLLGMAAGAIVLALIERRRDRSRSAHGRALGDQRRDRGAVVRGRAGPRPLHGLARTGRRRDLCAHRRPATRPLLLRVRARLDPEAAAAVPLYAEAFGVLLAALSVVAPPVGLVGLVFLLWLLIAGRRARNRSTQACGSCVELPKRGTIPS